MPLQFVPGHKYSIQTRNGRGLEGEYTGSVNFNNSPPKRKFRKAPVVNANGTTTVETFEVYNDNIDHVQSHEIPAGGRRVKRSRRSQRKRRTTRRR